MYVSYMKCPRCFHIKKIYLVWWFHSASKCCKRLSFVRFHCQLSQPLIIALICPKYLFALIEELICWKKTKVLRSRSMQPRQIRANKSEYTYIHWLQYLYNVLDHNERALQRQQLSCNFCNFKETTDAIYRWYC